MAKAIILSADELGSNLIASANAVDAYRWALDHAGINMDDEGTAADFIVARNAKSGWRDLWEFKAWLEKTAESIKEVMKHTFNVGDADQMPMGIKWKSGGTTKEFADGAGAIIADTLIKKHLVTKEQLFNTLSVTNVCKASGIKADKLVDMFPDAIIEKEKASSLIVM